jgi:hypothetical protein
MQQWPFQQTAKETQNHSRAARIRLRFHAGFFSIAFLPARNDSVNPKSYQHDTH